MVLSISENTPELILPCCPTDKPPKKVRTGVKGHQVHLTLAFLELISVLVNVLPKRVQICLLICAKMLGLMLSYLQSGETS